jgi:Putative prokaryotic signal transducing protein
MVKFYDPKDAADLARVEAVLKEGGIEYFLSREPAAGIGPMQVHVAEEDIPHAEKLLRKAELRKGPPH